MGSDLEPTAAAGPAEPEARSEGDAPERAGGTPLLPVSAQERSPVPTNDHSVLAELLAANRELVEVNRQIAASLANLERLYAEDLHSRQKLQRLTKAQFRRLDGHPLRNWPFIMLMVLIPAVVFGMPVIMKWLGQ
jgi:hypothetical protein